MGKKKDRIVIALGGNALQDTVGLGTAEEQLSIVKKTVGYIGEIIHDGYQIVLVHGNGPQVGRILLASETAKDVTPIMPFDCVGAMSQGYIGYHIQQALEVELRNRGCPVPVVTLITQVVVDKDDPAFLNPTKPIGPFYSRAEAEKIAAEKAYVMKEDSGRGWRRVVASPMPEKIVEIDMVKKLWDSSVVIAAGGGGVPVIVGADGSLVGVPAVIDKDFAAELLAEQVGADIFLILTAVDKVSINFNKTNQRDLDIMTVEKGETYIAQGQFAEGSMLPKVEAAMKFVKSGQNRKAIIASLYNGIDALKGKSGTIITL